jgi:hypothetical protein
MAFTGVLDNGISFEGSGRSTLDALIVESVKQADLMPSNKEVASIIGFIDDTIRNPDQTFSMIVPPTGLKSVTESGLKDIGNFEIGPKKGVYQREVGREYHTTFLMSQWIKNGKNIEGAPDGIQAEAINMSEQARYLVMAYDRTFAEEMIKVLTKGFSISSTGGPGNATAKGLPLFSASHPIGNTGAVQSNLVTGSSWTNVATFTTQLQSAIDLLRKIRMDNGQKPLQSGGAFRLLVSREREVLARQTLNDNSNFSGQGSNANQLNQFNFKGNLVELVVLPQLGEPDADGVEMGTADYWFVINTDGAKKYKALRKYTIYSPHMNTYEDKKTNVFITDIRAVVGADTYGAELFITGCQQ